MPLAHLVPCLILILLGWVRVALIEQPIGEPIEISFEHGGAVPWFDLDVRLIGKGVEVDRSARRSKPHE